MKAKIVFLIILFIPSFIRGYAQNENTKIELSKLKGPYLGQTPPGNKPEIFAPGIICFSDQSEFSETFSSDGKTFFYTKWKTSSRVDERIWQVRKDDGIWLKPSLAPFTYDCFEYKAFFSFDGFKVYYLSKRPLPRESSLNKYANLWVIEKTGDHWSESQFISLGNQIYPRYFSVSKCGTIYFNMEGKAGIFKSSLIDGSYSSSEKLPDEINSVKGASHAFIASDETYLIFDALGNNDIEGNYDLFISYKNDKGNWGPAIHLGNEINSPYFEGAASVSPDGKYFFLVVLQMGNQIYIG